MFSAFLLVSLATVPRPLVVVADDASRALTLTNELTADGSFVDLDEVLRAPRTVDDAALDERFSAVAVHLRSLSFAEARTTLQGIEASLSGSDWRRTNASWLKLWALRGFVDHLENEKDPQRGVRAVTEAFSVDPELTLEVPKAERFARWLDEQRQKAKQLAGSRRRIDSTVPALVWVDGRLRGLAPVDVELPPGPHLIVAAQQRAELLQVRVEVAADAVIRLPAAPPLAALARREQLVETARAVAPLPADAPLDELVTVFLSADGAQVTRQARASASTETSTATAEGVRSALSRPAVVTTATVTSTRTPRLISFISAGVLAVAAAIALGVGQATFGAAAQVPQVEDARYRAMMRDGRGWMTGFGVAGALAVAAAGVGVVLSF